MAKNKLVVTTDVGTFTRTTARDYAFIIVVKGQRAEWLEANRVENLKHARREAAKYRKIVETNGASAEIRQHPVSAAFDREQLAARLADGSFTKWAEESEASALRFEAQGTITEDKGDEFFVQGWTSRLDLARKLVGTYEVEIHREARIYALDGTLVRTFRASGPAPRFKHNGRRYVRVSGVALQEVA